MKKILKFFIRLYYYNSAKLKKTSYKSRPFINGRSIFSSNTLIGYNCHFNGIHIQGNGNVSIGNNFHSGSECLIITSFHNYDFGTAIPYDNSYIDKDVTINDNVWIGSRVIILGGVTIGEGAIIQAGAVVIKDIPPHSIVGGNPAISFKIRNIEHYNKLKNEGKFF